MDPASDDEEAQAMALAMGFSTFGTKPSAKKRKFNPSTDAFVEGQDLEKLDRGGKRGKGTGGNMIPVGIRKTRIPPAQLEEAVKDLVDDPSSQAGKNTQAEGDATRPSIPKFPERSESDTEGAPNYMDTSRPPPIIQKSPERSEDEEDDGPRYMDTSEAAPIHRKSGATEADDFLSTIPSNPISNTLSMHLPPPINAPPGVSPISLPFNTIQPPLPGITHQTQRSLPPGVSQPLLIPMSPPPDLPTKPPLAKLPNSNIRAPSPTGSSHSSVSTNTKRGYGSIGSRERNEKWYEGYYDPTFNQNPWEPLEKAHGLKSVGSFVPFQKMHKQKIV